MSAKKILVVILLAVSFCFASGAGYGEIAKSIFETKAPQIQVTLLRSLVRYMMRNPTSFLEVRFGYSDPDIILLHIFDNRNRFSYKSGIALLDTFKKELEIIYSFMVYISSDMDTDVWAWFYSREGIELGYFLDGKYHLSED